MGNFDLIFTPFGTIKVETGGKSNIEKSLKKIYQIARKLTSIFFKIKELESQRNFLKENIVKFAEQGFRGLVSEKDNFDLTVFPREIIEWEREKLKRALGILYPNLVSETLSIKITLPIGIQRKGTTISEGLITEKILATLVKMGFSQDEIKKIFSKEIELAVNENKLKELILKGQIEIPDEAKKREIVWVVKIERLKK